MKWFKSNSMNLIAGLGFFLFFGGIIFLSVSKLEIDGLEVLLDDELLDEKEVWRFEGALTWWTNTYHNVAIPWSTGLVISGMTILISQLLFYIVEGNKGNRGNSISKDNKQMD